jgi:cytochrome c5
MHRVRSNDRILFLSFWTLVAVIAAAELGGGLAAQASASVSNDPQAQIEKGRTAVGQTCAACHAGIMRMAQAQKQNQEQWKDTIFSMIGRGAEILPDEIDPIAAFLAATSAGAGNGQADAQTAQRGGGRQGPGRPEQAGNADGSAILQRTCQQCHDMKTATTKTASEEWSAVIAKMVGYGAKLSPPDQQKLIEYLEGTGK